MKLGFDPKKNMSMFDYYYAKINAKINKINDLISMSKIAKNWIEVAFFRIGLKKSIMIKFRDGKTFYVKDRKAYFDLWNSELGQTELTNLIKEKVSIINNKRNQGKINYKGRGIYFFFDTMKQRIRRYCNLLRHKGCKARLRI